MSLPGIFSRYLRTLGVPYTEWHSEQAFQNMTFTSIYGVAHLLQQYHIDLPFATILSPAAMNKIHFGGNIAPRTSEQFGTIAHSGQAKKSSSLQIKQELIFLPTAPYAASKWKES